MNLLRVTIYCHLYQDPVAYLGIFFGGGGVVQQVQLRTEDREKGDPGAVAPSQGFWRQL